MKKGRFDWVTQEMFDKKLGEILEQQAGTLLSIPGMYEVVSEYFNNDVLRELESEREEPKEFQVSWEIEVMAYSAMEAAEKALKIQRDPESLATVFSVKVSGQENAETVDVQLKEQNDKGDEDNEEDEEDEQET